MANTRSEKVALNAGTGIALKLMNQLMALVLKTVFIHTLGAQYNGVSTLFTDILRMLALAELGVGSAITFALYRPIKEGDYRRIAGLMHFYRNAYRLIAGVVMGAGLACMPFLQYMVKGVPDIKEDIRLIFLLYVVNSASSYLLVYKSTLLTASERGYMISKVGIWFGLIRTVSECILLVLFKNFILYLLVGIAEAILKNLVVSRKAQSYFPQLAEYKDERLSRDETKRLLGDVSALMLYKVCNVVLSSTDSIVISWALPAGVVSVGFLGNYRLLFSTILKFITQFYQSFTPSLGNMAADASAERQHGIFKTTTFVSFWSMCFCITSLFVLATPFVRDIWIRRNSAVLPFDVLLVLTLNFYVNMMIQPVNAFRDSNGLFVQGKYRPVFMVFINIALDIVLVKIWGMFGVLLATTIARLSTQVWYDPWLVYKRVFKQPVGPYFIRMGIYTLVVGASCAITYYLSHLIGQAVANVYLAFMLRMGLCLVIPNLLVVLLYRRTPEYRDFMARLTRILSRIARKITGRPVKKKGPAA